MNHEGVSWSELAIRLTPIAEAASIKGVTPENASGKLNIARGRLKKQGWQFLKREGTCVIVEAVPPEGFTAERWITERCGNPVPAQVSDEQLRHWQETEEKSGRPVLTWREMAILGWSIERAQDHRGTSTYMKAGQMLQEARAKLRKQGWTFDARLIGSPPALQPRTADYLQEKADAQQKSNWLLRLPASAL